MTAKDQTRGLMDKKMSNKIPLKKGAANLKNGDIKINNLDFDEGSNLISSDDTGAIIGNYLANSMFSSKINQMTNADITLSRVIASTTSTPMVGSPLNNFARYSFEFCI